MIVLHSALFWQNLLRFFWVSASSHLLAVSDTPKDGAVRISGGNTDAGRAEIFLAGQWGAICAYGSNLGPWGLVEADIFCRELGLRRGIGIMRMANVIHVSPVVGAICTGNETNFSACKLVRADAAADPKCTGIGMPPATAGVRCTNFVAEEQPDVVIGNGSYAKSELQSLLGGAKHHLSCEERKGTEATSFACTIAAYSPSDDIAGLADTCVQELDGRCLDHNEKRCDQPNPFSLASLDAFVFEDEMRSSLQDAEKTKLEALADNITHPCEGVEVTPIGLRLDTSLLSFGGKALPERTHARIAALKKLYLSPIARTFLDLDVDVYSASISGESAGLSEDAHNIYTSLVRDGLAQTHDAGLDIKALQIAVQDAFAREDPLQTSRTSGGVIATREKLPALEGWLRSNKTMPSAIAAYFGGKAILHGYKAVHLPASLTTDSYVASHWHHDRAGRRLKLFILLHDLDAEEGHPTKVAKGSHDLVYYWHEEYQHSRYKDAYVQSTFEAETLSGAAGSAYVFDSNAIHKGTPEGSKSREVVIIEFHHAAKCSIIDRLGLNVPCPSGDQRVLNWVVSASHGAEADPNA